MNYRLNSKPEFCESCPKVFGIIETESKLGEVKTMACAAGILNIAQSRLGSAGSMASASETSDHVAVDRSILADAQDAERIISESGILNLCANLVATTGVGVELNIGTKKHTSNEHSRTDTDVLSAAETFNRVATAPIHIQARSITC